MKILAYAQMPISCLIILLFILVQNIRNMQDVDRKFIPTVLSSILFILFDLLISMMEDGIVSYSPIGFHITYIGYNASGCIMTFSWFRYGEIIVDFGAHTARIMKVFHVLAAIFLSLLFIPPLLPYFYTICADGVIEYNVLDLIWYGMHFIPGLIALTEALKAYNNIRRYAVRERYMPVLIFYFILLISAFAQNMIDNVFSVSLGILLASIYLFIVSLRSGISRDVLTGLNNRRQFLLDIDNGMKAVSVHHPMFDDPTTSDGLSLIMMDMDNFKMINDNHGHNMGDRALIDFSESLRRSCSGYDAKVYRYGGDEFAVLVGTAIPDKIRDLCSRISRDTTLIYDESQPFRLSVSIGYAIYDPNTMKSIPAFTEAADRRLYLAKQEFHSNKSR